MDLSKIKNVCTKLESIVVGVQGITKTSASTSDIWFITFENSVKYDGKPVDRAVLKLFFSFDNQFPKYYIDCGLINVIGGLNYESLIYKNVVNPIVLNKKCPFFIISFGVGTNCTYYDLLKLLEKQLDKSEADYNLKRNLLYMWVGDKTPSIVSYKDYKSIPSEYKINVMDKLYSYIMLRPFTEKHFTLADYIQTQLPGLISELWLILFQICVGLYAFETERTVHNDFHANNVVVEFLTDSTQVVQQVEDFTYKYTSKIRVAIFDFDRAFSEKIIEPNPILYDYCDSESGYQCNKFVRNRDVMQIFCGVIQLMSQKSKSYIEPLITVIAPIYTKDTILGFVNKHRYCTTDTAPSDLYELPQIINNCAQNAGIKTTNERVNISNPNTFRLVYGK